MYNPPSGASPRRTAPRNDVSAAFPPVLRYLMAHSPLRHRTRHSLCSKTLLPSAATRATPPLRASRARALHNPAAVPQSSSDSTAPQSLAAIPRPSQQTLRAITPASDLPNIARSTSAAPRRSPPSRPPSSVSVAASADDFPYKSRFRWYPERAICKALSLIRSRSRPARLSLRPDIALPFRRTSPNPASPSRPQRHLFPQSHRLSGG